MSLTLHTKRNVGVLLSHMSLTLHSKRDVGVLSSDMPLTLHSKKDVGVLSSDMSLPLHTKRNVGVYWYPLNLSLMSYVEDIVIFLGLSVFSLTISSHFICLRNGQVAFAENPQFKVRSV